MKASDLNFTVELKSTHSTYSRFPRENCAGVALLRPDENKQKYKLKITLQASTIKQAGIGLLGFGMVKLSDCSKGLQFLWQAEQGEHFKGYRLRPSGAYRNDDEIKKALAKNVGGLHAYMDVSIDFDKLDTKKTNKFTMKYVDIIHVAKHQIVLDISELRLYVAKPVKAAK